MLTRSENSTDAMKKTDLEIALEDHLKANSQLSSDSRYAPFFKRRSGGDSLSSPVKKEASSALSETEKVVKTVKRRVTKAAEDLTNAVTGAIP